MQGGKLEIWNEIGTKTTPKLTSVEAPKEGADAADCIRNGFRNLKCAIWPHSVPEPCMQMHLWLSSHWALQSLQLKNIFASEGAVKVERIWNWQ